MIAPNRLPIIIGMSETMRRLDLGLSPFECSYACACSPPQTGSSLKIPTGYFLYAPPLPMLPNTITQTATNPNIQFFQLVLHVCIAKVPQPSSKIAVEFFQSLIETKWSGFTRDFLHLLLLAISPAVHFCSDGIHS